MSSRQSLATTASRDLTGRVSPGSATGERQHQQQPSSPTTQVTDDEADTVTLAFSILLLLTSALLVVLVLMHKGKGGGLSDMFGGGVSTGLAGSSVAERNLDRITVAVIAIWVACIVALGLMLTR